jgi:hypothetical protein
MKFDPLVTETLIFVLYKCPFSISQKNGGRNSVALSLMLFRGFMAAYCENRTETRNYTV